MLCVSSLLPNVEMKECMYKIREVPRWSVLTNKGCICKFFVHTKYRKKGSRNETDGTRMPSYKFILPVRTNFRNVPNEDLKTHYGSSERFRAWDNCLLFCIYEIYILSA